MKFRRWADDHFKPVGAFLLILAALNLLVSYTLFPDHPVMAAANATMALILGVGVIMSWRSS
jgi:hypothetical protein